MRTTRQWTAALLAVVAAGATSFAGEGVASGHAASKADQRALVYAVAGSDKYLVYESFARKATTQNGLHPPKAKGSLRLLTKGGRTERLASIRLVLGVTPQLAGNMLTWLNARGTTVHWVKIKSATKGTMPAGDSGAYTATGPLGPIFISDRTTLVEQPVGGGTPVTFAQPFTGPGLAGEVLYARSGPLGIVALSGDRSSLAYMAYAHPNKVVHLDLPADDPNATHHRFFGCSLTAAAVACLHSPVGSNFDSTAFREPLDGSGITEVVTSPNSDPVIAPGGPDTAVSPYGQGIVFRAPHHRLSIATGSEGATVWTSRHHDVGDDFVHAFGTLVTQGPAPHHAIWEPFSPSLVAYSRHAKITRTVVRGQLSS